MGKNKTWIPTSKYTAEKDTEADKRLCTMCGVILSSFDEGDICRCCKDDMEDNNGR